MSNMAVIIQTPVYMIRDRSNPPYGPNSNSRVVIAGGRRGCFGVSRESLKHQEFYILSKSTASCLRVEWVSSRGQQFWVSLGWGLASVGCRINRVDKGTMGLVTTTVCNRRTEARPPTSLRS
jgi:hypothetical protein